jgi:hypothetical protein
MLSDAKSNIDNWLVNIENLESTDSNKLTQIAQGLILFDAQRGSLMQVGFIYSQNMSTF